MVTSRQTIKQDVAVLQEQVREIKENHLAHLSQDIKDVHAKIDRGIALALTTTIGILIDLALKLWK